MRRDKQKDTQSKRYERFIADEQVRTEAMELVIDEIRATRRARLAVWGMSEEDFDDASSRY